MVSSSLKKKGEGGGHSPFVLSWPLFLPLEEAMSREVVMLLSPFKKEGAIVSSSLSEEKGG